MRAANADERTEMISLEGVSAVYSRGSREIQALRGVDLDVVEGELISIEGPSGSGKSTLLRVIAGMWPATSGRVLLAGQLLVDLSDDELAILRRREVGFVHQLFNLLPDLDAHQNIGLPLLLDSVEEEEARGRVLSMSDRLGIADTLDRFPDELSGGQMLRVALARALVIEPSVLLADEPTGSLDQENSRRVIELFREVNSTLGTTTVIVTHDPKVAEGSDRRIRLVDGRIEDG